MEIIRDRHQHPLLDVVARVSGELDKAATFNPTFVPTTDKATALRELSAIVTRAQGLLLTVLAASGDVADETGARTAGEWYAATTRHDHKPAHGLHRLARSLDQHYPHLGAAVLAGRVNLDQAHVIAHALDTSPPPTSHPVSANGPSCTSSTSPTTGHPPHCDASPARSSTSSLPKSATKPNAEPSNAKNSSQPNTPD